MDIEIQNNLKFSKTNYQITSYTAYKKCIIPIINFLRVLKFSFVHVMKVLFYYAK